MRTGFDDYKTRCGIIYNNAKMSDFFQLLFECDFNMLERYSFKFKFDLRKSWEMLLVGPR